MKTRHVLLSCGVIVAGWLALFGDKTPSTSIAEAVSHTTKKGNAGATTVVLPVVVNAVPLTAATSARAKPDLVILSLRPREELLGGSQAERPSDSVFGSQSWVPPPPPPPKPEPPPPPTAPALPFSYLGKKTEDGKLEIYLARGEQTFIVHEQSLIDGLYRVESIKPPTMTLIYLPLKQIQTLFIGGVD